MRLRLLAAGLLAAALGLAWLCFTLLTAPVSVGEIELGPPWSPDLAAPIAAGSFATTPGADAAILARLVFSPTRRLPEARPPPSQDQNAQAEQAAEPPQPVIDIAPPDAVVLHGVFIDEKRRAALITAPDHLDGIWLKPGDDLEGWKVSRIDADGIALANGRREIALTLYVENSRSQ